MYCNPRPPRKDIHSLFITDKPIKAKKTTIVKLTRKKERRSDGNISRKAGKKGENMRAGVKWVLIREELP